MIDEPAPHDRKSLVWLVAAGVVVLLLAVAGRYGFHRDELYFVVAGRNLAWGFVDQPPFTPLVARISELIGGTSPVAIRVLPAFAIGGVVLLAADMAKRLGGGRRAQVFAGLAAGGAGFALAVGHLLSTATFDYLLWTAGTWILVRLLDGADRRWWLGLGLVVGIGLLNKHLMAFFAVAVLLALLLTPQRRRLAGAWPWAGALLAGAIALPNFIWQAANDFPQLEMAQALSNRSDGPVAFVLEQVGLLSIVLAVPAAIGLWRLLRSKELERWRPLGIAFVILFLVFLVTGGKSYYVAPLYPVLLAVGALWFEALEGARRVTMTTAAALGIFVGMFISLPLLPPDVGRNLDATGELGETVGWPELVDQVAAVHAGIPEELRNETTIFTGSYGQAGAVDVLGPERGLPAAVSGHNNYWVWGPPESHGPIIALGRLGDVLAPICPTIQRVATIDNPYGVENEEAGQPILLCAEPTGQLADIWDSVRHYN